MRVRMTTQVSGTRDGRKWPDRGEEVVLPDAEGAALCAGGMAEPVAETKRAETRPATKAKAAETRES